MLSLVIWSGAHRLILSSTMQHPERTDLLREFAKYWRTATDDHNETLHGFRRFKTTQLLNLRFLEDEIEELDGGAMCMYTRVAVRSAVVPHQRHWERIRYRRPPTHRARPRSVLQGKFCVS
jgi:hypothetical protein